MDLRVWWKDIWWCSICYDLSQDKPANQKMNNLRVMNGNIFFKFGETSHPTHHNNNNIDDAVMLWFISCVLRCHEITMNVQVQLYSKWLVFQTNSPGSLMTDNQRNVPTVSREESDKRLWRDRLVRLWNLYKLRTFCFPDNSFKLVPLIIWNLKQKMY